MHKEIWGAANAYEKTILETAVRAYVKLSDDHGDTDRKDDRDEVDVPEGRNLSERRWDGKQHKDNSRDDPKGEGTYAATCDPYKGNGAGQAVRASSQDQQPQEDNSKQLIPKASHQNPPSIDIMIDIRIFQLNETDHITSIHSNKFDSDAACNASNHSKGSESSRET
ncbi:hypothetical protein FCOIX_10000 [Fusarium coicis]|nr:hypothetical protein FCOIX_10000 [Fusarium coicis]